jgi:hypothetical protein
MEPVGLTAESRSGGSRPTLRLRYIGIILPAVINYGFLLLNDDQPNWAALAASAVVLLVVLVFLALRGDRRGAMWVLLLYFPLNAWPIVLNVMGGLGD